MGLSTILRLAPALALLGRVRGIGRPAFSHLLLPLRVWTVRPTRGLTLRLREGILLVARARDRRPGADVPAKPRRTSRWRSPFRGGSPAPANRVMHSSQTDAAPTSRLP